MQSIKVEYDHIEFELEYENGEWTAPFTFAEFTCRGPTPGAALDAAIEFLDHVNSLGEAVEVK